MSRRTIIPLAAMEKILKVAGAERVSDPAKEALRDVLEAFGEEVAHNAIKLAAHAGRKTIKSSDIKLATK